MFLLLLLELFLTGKLYYTTYLLFFFPLIHSFLFCFFAFRETDFIFDCCYSDYGLGNWKNPRYPRNFWFYFKDAEYYFGFEHEFTEKQVNEIKKEMEKAKWSLRKKVSFDEHGYKLFKRIVSRNPLSFNLRVANWYKHIYKVRWVHTERVIYQQ